MSESVERVTKVIAEPLRSELTPMDRMPVRPFSSLKGCRIGRYELIYHIASGGMASVFAARLSGLAGFERLVAIKIIHPHLTEEQSFVRMFLDEARLAARISHPNVAEIYEVGEADGIYYMVGELVQGKDLRQILEKATKRNISLPVTAMVKSVSNICAGLAAAHELVDDNGELLNLIHRDVSTRNVLISYSGLPKLIDFGAAFAKGKLAHTATGVVKGKIGYMPPEQLRGDAIDHRADIYALGVVLYTVSTSCHPFPYDNEGQQISQTLAGRFLRPREINSDLDSALENIILKAMSLNPPNRFQSMNAFHRSLEAWLTAHSHDASESLSTLMKTLFESEIELEQRQILSHREKQNGTAMNEVFARHVVDDIAQQQRPVVGFNQRWLRLFAVRRRGLMWLWGVIGLLLLLVGLWILQGGRYDAQAYLATPERRTELVASPPSPDAQTFKHIPDILPLSPQHDTVTVRIEGVSEAATFWLNGRQLPFPLVLPRSDKPVEIEMRTPEKKDSMILVVPDRDKFFNVLPVSNDHQKKRLPRVGRTGYLKKFSTGASKADSLRKQKAEDDREILTFESNPFQSSQIDKEDDRSP